MCDCSLNYVARLVQIGPNPPVATVIKNSFSSEIVWARIAEGVYRGTSSIGWRKEKSVVFINGTSNDLTVLVGAFVASDTEIFIILSNEDQQNVFNLQFMYNPAI